MTARNRYIAGLTFIGFGLIMFIPLYVIRFRLKEIFIVIPVIYLFVLTGISVIKSRKYSWSLSLILGAAVTTHFALQWYQFFFKPTDVFFRPETIVVIFLIIWSLLTPLMWYSILNSLRRDSRVQLNIGAGQYFLTAMASFVTVISVTYLIVKDWYWLG